MDLYIGIPRAVGEVVETNGPGRGFTPLSLSLSDHRSLSAFWTIMVKYLHFIQTEQPNDNIQTEQTLLLSHSPDRNRKGLGGFPTSLAAGQFAAVTLTGRLLRLPADFLLFLPQNTLYKQKVNKHPRKCGVQFHCGEYLTG